MAHILTAKNIIIDWFVIKNTFNIIYFFKSIFNQVRKT